MGSEALDQKPRLSKLIRATPAEEVGLCNPVYVDYLYTRVIEEGEGLWAALLKKTVSLPIMDRCPQNIELSNT